jgi:hypothetical protein
LIPETPVVSGAYGACGCPVDLGGTLDAIAEALEGDPGRADALIATAWELDTQPAPDGVPF